MYLLNGESKHDIVISDRGFQYGDGLFETIEVVNGTPVFLKQHLHRLLEGCKKLLIPPPDIEILSREAFQVSADSDKAVLKLIVTRGSGGRGYRQPANINPTRLFSIHPYPDYPDTFGLQGVTVRYCDTRLGLNPALAGVKHMNRLEQVLARSEWESSDIQEGLMLDSNGSVIEGTMSNVFLVKDKIVHTPLIEQCGVAGIIRQIVLLLARKKQIPVIETALSQDDIDHADEVFLTNCVIGIWPVKQIERRPYNVGPLTKQFQVLFENYRQMEINDS